MRDQVDGGNDASWEEKSTQPPAHDARKVLAKSGLRHLEAMKLGLTREPFVVQCSHHLFF